MPTIKSVIHLSGLSKISFKNNKMRKKKKKFQNSKVNPSKNINKIFHNTNKEMSNVKNTGYWGE